MTERTPTDYALEFAEYMAKGAEQLIEAVNALAMAEQARDEGDGDELDAKVDEARQDCTEFLTGLRNDIHQFRTRRDRAARAAQSSTVGERERFEAWARRFSTLSLERDSHGHYVSMEQELLWLGFQAGKGKAPEGAFLSESNADAGLGLAGPDSACAHDFALQPSSSIRLCAKCGIGEVAARADLAPAAQAEPAEDERGLALWQLIYGAIAHEPLPLKVAQIEAAAKRVEDMLRRRAAASNPPAQGIGTASEPGAKEA